MPDTRDDELLWARMAALGGVAFVVLTLLGAFLPGSPPSPSDSAAKITAYLADHSGRIEAAAVLTGVGIIGLLWWFGTVWRLMVRAEAERPRLAVVAAVGLAVSAALGLLSSALTSAMALRVDELGDGSRVFYTLSTVVLGISGFPLVAHVAAVAALNYRRRFLPSWLTYLGWVVAAGFLVSGLGSASDANAYVVVGLIAFIAWSVWILGISATVWRSPPAAVRAG